MEAKHKSKLLKGFEKQIVRQGEKPREVKIKLRVAIQLPKNFKGKYKHTLTVSNSNWNGMNLKQLRNNLTISRVGGMYGKFIITAEGKYKLSRYGKDLLRRRKLSRKERLKTV